jgi:uncharacterized protein (DUF433 family)
MAAQETVPSTVDLRKYIDFKLYGERPHIRGRRLPVTFVSALAAHEGLTISQLAYEFTISEEEVLAALLYYREHKAELDRQDEEAQKEFDEMKRLYGNNATK